jgi:sugar lactone lactonase YvrE
LADGAGNVYIADQWNQRIRKVSSGNISTFAGSGLLGFAGDGGLATSPNVAMWVPSGMAFDSAKNLYFADTRNYRIRKVDTGGNLSTFAGTGSYRFGGDNGLATSALLNGPNGPFGVAVDASGNVYIADTSNYRIRKVATNGKITTFAGDGTENFRDGVPATSAGSGLSYPGGVAVDGNTPPNVYIADTYHNRIRKVDPSGNITTVAGNGNSGFGGDNGPATSAMLNAPRGLAMDSSGNIFVADQGNNRIR